MDHHKGKVGVPMGRVTKPTKSQRKEYFKNYRKSKEYKTYQKMQKIWESAGLPMEKKPYVKPKKEKPKNGEVVTYTLSPDELEKYKRS